MISTVTAVLAALLYGVLARQLPAAPAPVRGHAYVLLGSALGLHALSQWRFDTWSFDFRFFAAVSWVGFCMAIALLSGLHRGAWRALTRVGLVLVALAALTGALSAGGSLPTGRWQIELHAAIALFAYALLSLATVQSLLLAWTEQQLRVHRVHLRWLPPLSSQEQLFFQLVGAGFVLLTVTLLTGALFTHDWREQHLAHKIVFTACAWALFGVLLLGRWRFGWRGRTAVRFTLIGMATLGLAFLGTKFVLEVLLARR